MSSRRTSNQFNNLVSGKNLASVPQEMRLKYQRQKKEKEIVENLSSDHVYELAISDKLLVKVKFPREEKDLKTRDFQIRNAMQWVFHYVYGIENRLAMIMANMNREDKTIEQFCESYGISSSLPKAKELYNQISCTSIEFDLSNINASVKVDGEYFRKTKFTDGTEPKTTTPEGLTFEKIEINQMDIVAVVGRMNRLIEIFEEELIAAKNLYNFDVEISQSDIKPNYKIKPYYKVFIKGEDEVDGVIYPEKTREKVPVFEISLEKYTGEKKYFLDYTSTYFGYNSSEIWLYNDVAIRDHIKKWLLSAVHYFTTNIVQEV